MAKRILFINLFFIVLQSFVYADNVFNLSVTGKNYEQLRLKVFLDSQTPSVYIEGNKKDKNNWEFHIPDNIYERHRNMTLVVSSADSTKVYQLIIQMHLNNDTLNSMQFSIGKKRSELNLSYIKTEIKEKVPYLSNKDAIYDYFLVKRCDTEFESSLIKLHSLFGFFRKPYTYEENLDRYISLINKYPDSYSCMAMLYETLNKYKSKGDIASVFSCFSPSVKENFYGRLIQSYLDIRIFPNYQLPVLDTNKMEYIISDPHKQNLVVFTASWCKPCHELIPELKKLYNDLQDKLVITYISIDDSKTINQWTEVIHKYKIPWRCLKAASRLDEIMQSYTIQGIPLAYLVQPDGTFEILNLQRLEDRNILY